MWLEYSGKQAEGFLPEQHWLSYSRLVDPVFNLFGVVAGGAESLGFAHFYFHPSTQRPSRSGQRAASAGSASSSSSPKNPPLWCAHSRA